MAQTGQYALLYFQVPVHPIWSKQEYTQAASYLASLCGDRHLVSLDSDAFLLLEDGFQALQAHLRNLTGTAGQVLLFGSGANDPLNAGCVAWLAPKVTQRPLVQGTEQGYKDWLLCQMDEMRNPWEHVLCPANLEYTDFCRRKAILGLTPLAKN
jgi:hypothetical protein